MDTYVHVSVGERERDVRANAMGGGHYMECIPSFHFCPATLHDSLLKAAITELSCGTYAF